MKAPRNQGFSSPPKENSIITGSPSVTSPDVDYYVRMLRNMTDTQRNTTRFFASVFGKWKTVRPSQAYIGKVIGRVRETACIATQRLRDLGIIRKSRLRVKQRTEYRPGKLLANRAFREALRIVMPGIMLMVSALVAGQESPLWAITAPIANSSSHLTQLTSINLLNHASEKNSTYSTYSCHNCEEMKKKRGGDRNLAGVMCDYCKIIITKNAGRPDFSAILNVSENNLLADSAHVSTCKRLEDGLEEINWDLDDPYTRECLGISK